MANTLKRLLGVNLKGFQLVRYSDSRRINLGSLEPVRFKGSTLESALASKEGFDADNLTLVGLARMCQEIRKIDLSDVPGFFFDQNRSIPRRFIAGGTLLVHGGVKYVLAFSFIGQEWLVRPVVLSTKNTSDYYFLVKKGSA